MPAGPSLLSRDEWLRISSFLDIGSTSKLAATCKSHRVALPPHLTACRALAEAAIATRSALPDDVGLGFVLTTRTASTTCRALCRPSG